MIASSAWQTVARIRHTSSLNWSSIFSVSLFTERLLSRGAEEMGVEPTKLGQEFGGF